MIIQCEQCRTKFKLDDSKVPDKGVKVRCVKCKNVFSVTREQPEAVPQADFGSMLDSSVSLERDTLEVQPEFMAAEDTSEIEFEETEPSPEHSTLSDSDAFEIQEEEETQFTHDISSEDESISSPEVESMFAPVQVEAEDSSDDIDFGAFNFGDDNNDAETTETAPHELNFGTTPKIQPAAIESEKDDFGGLDFSGDDMFGEVIPAAQEESAGSISFDFGVDDFSSSMGVDTSKASKNNSFTISESSSDAPFSLDEIDFGDEFTSVGVQHVSPEELQPSQELLFAPLAEAQAKPVFDNSSKNQTHQEELPPLSIASRRKQSPVFTGLFALIGIIIAGIVVYFVYSMFAGEKPNMAEIGNISIRQLDATFVKNKLAGDLLVISGEAVNEFKKPRATIQIKGMVYGANGEVISSKNAFCGNPLTAEQLSTMSMEDIEAAMANQFGDSLANMEVAPGKAIPFVIVIEKPPAGAKDYGVEAAGSTVATVKPQ